MDKHKLIALTQGQFAIVDAADFDWLNQWKWYARWDKTIRSFYAARNVGKPCIKTLYMHQLILPVPKGMRRDHANRNTLDNRRINLRPANKSQSAINQGRRKDNTSGFKGVAKEGRRWFARLQVNGKIKRYGTFDSPEDAARAYDKAALSIFGEFAYLNFPVNSRVAGD